MGLPCQILNFHWNYFQKYKTIAISTATKADILTLRHPTKYLYLCSRGPTWMEPLVFLLLPFIHIEHELCTKLVLSDEDKMVRKRLVLKCYCHLLLHERLPVCKTCSSAWNLHGYRAFRHGCPILAAVMEREGRLSHARQCPQESND